MSNEKQETVDDIVREMRDCGNLDRKSTDRIPRSLMGLGLRTYADRLKAAAKRERESVTNSHAIGNAAAMREALVWMGERMNAAVHDGSFDCYEALQKIDAVLAKPPRNCDRFDDLNSAQRHYIEHGCPKGLGMIVDGEIRKTPWKSQFEKWLFDKEKGENDGSK